MADPHEMFTCKSFLLRPKVRISDLNHIDPAWFIDVDNTEEVQRIARYVDKKYIDGAILLNYFDKEILTFREWEALNHLWIYLAVAIDKLLQDGTASMSFPDAPMEMDFEEYDRGFIKLHTKWNNKRFFVPEKELLLTLLQGSVHFFDAINKPLDLHSTYALERQYFDDLLQRVYGKFL
nr:hypothetical protein [uncultured Selenomonas sp.]